MYANLFIKDAYCQNIRFPTSHTHEGTDAMHVDCDYSAAYVHLIIHDIKSPAQSFPEGHGIIFTIGRGTSTIIECFSELKALFRNESLQEIYNDFAGFWRKLTCDSQMRWIGPEKGVVHLTVAGIVNALWDLLAKLEGKPLWKLLVDMPPKQLISCLDFRYVSDVISPEEALKILQDNWESRKIREKEMIEKGFPAYTTAVGWAGYSDEKVKDLCLQSLKQGFTAFKVKVGCGIEKDLHRVTLIREIIGKDSVLMTDANQVWTVPQAIEAMKALAHLNIYWIEEPTAPDDVYGHAEIAKALNPLGIRVATGEHAHNRILHKQFLLANGYQTVQSDACRLAGLNELILVCLMAKKFNKPVCLHAGGVGLCEMGVHAALFDYIAITNSLQDRWFEYAGALHEHFEDPVKISNGRYVVPKAPGYAADLLPSSIEKFEFPNGFYWKTHRKMKKFVGFQGIMAATFTPFSQDAGQLDLSVIQDYAEDLVKQKVTGVFLNGSAGESVSLTVAERKQVLEAWMNTKSVKEKKLHVIVHVGALALPDVLELARHAESLNVYAVAVMPPCYFKARNCEEMAEVLVTVAKYIPETAVYYYHIPHMNGINLEVKKILDICKRNCENVVGAKFTASDFADLGRCIASGYNMLVGADNMVLAALAVGCQGAIGITYNFAGRLHYDIYEKFANGEIKEANQLQEISRVLCEKLYSVGINAASKFLQEMIRGINMGPLRWPQAKLTKEKEEEFRRDEFFDQFK